MPTKTQRSNRTKTVRALRSGKFTQGLGALRKVIGTKAYHCCLGVASEVCGIAFEMRGIYARFYFPNDGYDDVVIPNADAAVMFGITVEQADYLVTRAVEMNDKEQLPFTEIAKRFSKFFKMCDAWNTYHNITI